MKKIVAIHQPNFFPWLGYFDKIIKSDTFIVLDHVQFPKKGSCMGNRVNFLIANEAKWITAPVIKKHPLTMFNEVEFDDRQKWRIKMDKTLIANYSKSPFYSEVKIIIDDILNQKTVNISEFNVYTIKRVLEYLDFQSSSLVLSSELSISSSSTQLLIDLVKAVGGDTYLAGGGAQGYQDDKLFSKQNIRLVYQNFQQANYVQCNKEFIPGLSIIDALMNVGKAGVKQLLLNDGENV